MTKSATEKRLDPAFIKWFALHARIQRAHCIQECLLALGPGTRVAFLAVRTTVFKLIFGAIGSTRIHGAGGACVAKGARPMKDHAPEDQRASLAYRD